MRAGLPALSIGVVALIVGVHLSFGIARIPHVATHIVLKIGPPFNFERVNVFYLPNKIYRLLFGDESGGAASSAKDRLIFEKVSVWSHTSQFDLGCRSRDFCKFFAPRYNFCRLSKDDVMGWGGPIILDFINYRPTISQIGDKRIVEEYVNSKLRLGSGILASGDNYQERGYNSQESGRSSRDIVPISMKDGANLQSPKRMREDWYSLFTVQS